MRKIKEIMTTDCVSVTLQDNVYELAVKMSQHDIGFIPVLEGKKLVGVVTDRDIVVRGLAEKREGSAAVEQVMTKHPITVSPDTTVDEAAKLMAQKQIRRLVVVENGELLGIVALADMAVRNIYEEEAGEALSEISEPSKQFSQS